MKKLLALILAAVVLAGSFGAQLAYAEPDSQSLLNIIKGSE